MMLFTGAVCAGTKEKTAPRLRGACKRKGFWMKKFFAALLAAVMMLALAACGGDSGKTVDVQKLADDLKDNVPYSTNMIASAVEDLEYKLDPPEGTAIAGYIADGSAYDMIVVAQCASADDAKTLYANTQTYLDDLKREANLYQPSEEARLDGALLRQSGAVVVLCVSDDTAAATAIVEGYLK